ncbi:adhesion G-protein coupled receptor G2 isoform X2 [Rhineura floridana]|nr:adhesion G-protein coupled receptor G2 isoform X2 [Rhineura floridana]XP_061483237.1 adhesion G-protein coupled receptor G2 isoform X2 [Rhineura floridana]
MIACGVYHSCVDRLREILPKCKVPLSLLLLHLFLAPSGRAENSFLGQYRAVFNTSCQEVWTLSPATSVPALTNFTVCIYLKLYNPKNSWTAFVYKKEHDGNHSASGHYELGLTGGHDKLTVWIFGEEITWEEKLKEGLWYQVCIGWRREQQQVSVYVNGEEKKTEEIKTNDEGEKTGQLVADGQLLLGCSQKPGVSSSSSDGMVGELYMFRMWAKGNINHTQNCQGGTIIRWRKDNWVYNKTAQYSNSLPCGNAMHLSSRLGKAPITASDASSVETLNTAEMTNVTEHGFLTTTAADGIMNTEDSAGSTSTNVVGVSSARTGGHRTELNVLRMQQTKILDNHLCNLSALCNDSVFYMGTVKFQISKNSSNASYNLTVQYPGDDTSQYQLKATSPPLQELKISDFNKTLQNLSESSGMQCDKVTQSSTRLECSFIIKLEKKMNISNLLSKLEEKAELGAIELCCCSGLQLYSCPSTVEDLRLLQCDMHGQVACTSLGTPGPPVSPVAPSTIPSDVVTQRGSLSSESNTVSPTPLTEPSTNGFATNTLTEQNTIVLPSAYPTKSTSAVLSPPLETINPVFTTVSSAKPTTTSVVRYSTTPTGAILHTTSKPTVAVSPTILSTSSAMDTTSDMHSITDSTGSPTKVSTEQISRTEPNITHSINVENIVSELERNLTAETISPVLASTMLDRVNFLLDIPQACVSPISKRIIKIVDAIGLKLNFSTESINLTFPSLALAVLKVNSSSFNSVSFVVEDSSDLQVTLGTQVPTNSAGSITLPSSIMTNLPSEAKNQASRITFNFFEKTTLFQDPSLDNLSLISHVISSSVANLTISNLKTDVTVTLQNARPSQENLSIRCAFWDFSKNGGKGGWTYEGCVVRERRTNATICSCNHLTSFGVLLDLSRNTTIAPIQVLILTFVTYIGCGLSAIFLSVTLVTYIAFEKIRRDYPSKILIQLCIALLLLNLVFLLDSWVALYNVEGLCISVAVFLHYFLLVSFTWMGLEAFHMYLALVKVFNTYVRKYILKFCIIGWGIPAIVVAIVLAISPNNYGLGSYGKFPNGSPDEFCWINNNIVFYITVVGYFCTIFLLNISMFIVVLIQLCRIKKKKQLGTQRKTSIQDLRSVAGLTFLLGITWGFAFFAWGPVNLVFMYLFAIFNTLQGFFIFIFYCVAKENVRKQWRRYLCCGKYRLAENSDWSRTATNGLKKHNVNQGVSSSSHSLQSNSNSTNSTSVLMNNDYSVHANGNGISSEKNGVSFNVHNGDVQLPDFLGKQLVFHDNNDTGHKKSCISLRRTSKRGSLHFIEPM